MRRLILFGLAAMVVAAAPTISCSTSIVIGVLDTDSGSADAAPDTKLPPLPPLTNVVATGRDDSVGIDFDPVDDAVDYRVYPLPSDGDITINADGSVTVKNAVYRCAGLRHALDLPNNTTNDLLAPDAGQSYVNGQYSWSAVVPASPTLGYVYVSPAPGRAPVYALAGYTRENEVGWRESRLKIYTIDASTRQTLRGQWWRDDGVVFYVPAASGSTTQTIYSSQTAMLVAGQGWTAYTQYYFTSGDLASHANDTTPPSPAFQVLAAPGADTKPLMAVLYQAGENHVELAVGKERFKRAANQGPGPLWHVEWAGLTGPTTLVVEALASGCPFQGFLSPQPLDAPGHQSFHTLDQLHDASPSGEVFINGQYDLAGTVDGGAPLLQTPTASPRAIARSFVRVAPQQHDPSAWDWYQGFAVGSDFGAIALAPIPGCYQCLRGQSPVFDVSAFAIDEPSGVGVFTYGQFLGQLWTAFDDFGGGTSAALRFTALKTATIDSDPTKFLHVTWSVDIVGTYRRYPEVLVSDQSAPVDDGFANANANTLVFHTIGGPSMRFEAQAVHGLVNGQPWAINNQAPAHALVDSDHSSASATGSAAIASDEPLLEHAGMDRMTRFDVYVSSQRVYAFVDGAPAGCMGYPSGFSLGGAVTVTFGDVIFDEGAADEMVCAQAKPYVFLHEHQCRETRRHFDDLAFKSGAPPPAWDETRNPCAPY